MDGGLKIKVPIVAVRVFQEKWGPAVPNRQRPTGKEVKRVDKTRTPEMSGKYVYTVGSPFPHSALGLKEKDQSCHHKVWMHLAHANPRGDRAAQYKHARQKTLERNSLIV